jgi:hypothetical protein
MPEFVILRGPRPDIPIGGTKDLGMGLVSELPGFSLASLSARIRLSS